MGQSPRDSLGCCRLREGDAAQGSKAPARWQMRSEQLSKPLNDFFDLFWVVIRQIMEFTC